ncbi:MAG TPA: S9 family peptidase [Nitrolancea sp.]|nr:S9 family peptidase [Nitrolancea sp.]
MDGSSSRRLLTPSDIYAIKLVSDARFSPGGDDVAYVQTSLDRETNDYQSSIAIVSTSGGDPRRFTGAGAKDTAPRWAPSGDRLAFLSNRSGSKQIWTIPYSGGEASQLTDLPEEITGFTWSPDGSTIAFVSKAVSPQAEQNSPTVDGREGSDVVHITKIRFRADGTPGFLDQKPTHLWVIHSNGGAPRQVTSGEFSDSQPAFSPDGRELAFVSNRTGDRDFNCASEIWAVSLQGGQPRCIAGGDDAYFWHPAWSPDGESIAISGHWQAATGHATNYCVWLAPSSGGGEPRNLTAALDRPAGDFAIGDTAVETDRGVAWSLDGSTLYFQVSEAGNVHLYRISVAGGDAERVVGGARRVLNFSLSGDGRVAFVASDPLNPGDVAVCAPDGTDEHRLTAVNADLMNAVALSTPEEFRIIGRAGDQGEIHGWIMKPVDFQEGRHYPMVLEIHGGPHALYANAYFNEFQLLAARGYVVVYTNPPGSQGYGESFAKYTQGAWGEKDMPDVMAAVDHVIAQGYVDPNRLGVTGGSYGGFLTNWIIGHRDRFRAAVTQRCVSNLASMYGTSDIGFSFGEYEFGGTPWDSPEQFARLSPITYVKEIRTPLLIIHSEQDYRCPVEQAEQLYVALKRLRREVEFVRFPNESHGLSRSGKPEHRVERLERILDWFDRYLSGSNC